MDYSACNALSFGTAGLKEAAVLYDVACQYSINFKQRIQNSSFLHMPIFDKLLFGVGKFHLGAHVDKCFFKFSLNFIRGMGQVDGEVVETLWSRFKRLAQTWSAMGYASRQENTDSHMLDSNAKKAKRLPKALVKKYKNADKRVKAAIESFQKLSLTLPEDKCQQWLEEENAALAKGGDALEVYGVKAEKGNSSLLICNGLTDDDLFTMTPVSPVYGRHAS